MMQFRYEVNERLPIRQLSLFGLQWFLAAIPMVIILGKVGAAFHYPQSPELQLLYLQKMFFVTGISMIAQLFWGHRLPLIVGPASVLLIGIIANAHAVQEQVVYCSIAIGGALLALLAITGLLARVSRLFTPRIIGVVLLLIAFTLLPTVVNLVTAGDEHPFEQLVLATLLLAACLLLPDNTGSPTFVFKSRSDAGMYRTYLPSLTIVTPTSAAIISLINGATLQNISISSDPLNSRIHSPISLKIVR